MVAGVFAVEIDTDLRQHVTETNDSTPPWGPTDPCPPSSRAREGMLPSRERGMWWRGVDL